jgi:hypothetical protein
MCALGSNEPHQLPEVEPQRRADTAAAVLADYMGSFIVTTKERSIWLITGMTRRSKRSRTSRRR